MGPRTKPEQVGVEFVSSAITLTPNSPAASLLLILLFFPHPHFPFSPPPPPPSQASDCSNSREDNGSEAGGGNGGPDWDGEEEDFYQPGEHGELLDDSNAPHAPPSDVEASFYGPGDKLYRNYHPKLNAKPCDVQGKFVQITLHMCSDDDLWAATLLKHGDEPPFVSWRHLYKTIDSTPLSDVKWQRYKIQYTGDMPDLNPPPWMQQTFKVWFWDVREVTHIILGNPSFAEEMNLQPFREFSTKGDEQQYQDFMSGDWAWDQADIISEDEKTHGSTFVPIILGSDKTTVSVGTGNNEYYPLYLSIGNV
ncbi:hypothetical protein HYDPIDRAFT_23740 [Hydnomerulius pinastri MD-312]|nr:hypothetical protein HYDPIDRAFT_23740 [Hydnomerulius pinastri MD-312]